MAKRAKAQSSQLLPLDAAMRCFARRESSVLMTSNIVFPSSIFFGGSLPTSQNLHK